MSANRIHLATVISAPGRKVRARCGWWTDRFTTDPSCVTCKACLLRTNGA